jgi:xanthine dehydrogenase YagS FAD-binding subunit
MNLHQTSPEFRAGGTDLSERRRSGISRGQIVDLTPTDTMTGVEWGHDGAARIGALVTIETLASDARVRTAYAGLAAAAAGLATPQIRSVGTLGGNLAQRSRCWYFRNPHLACLKKGDPVCPARAGNHLYGVAFDLGPCVAPHPSTLAAGLLAYDATVTTNERSELTIGALLGDGTDGTADNKLRPGEHIIHVDIGSPLEGERAGYHRVISRTNAEWPLVETVVRVVIRGERFEFVRVTAGGIAPVPLRFIDVEHALRSAVSDEASIRKAAALAAKNAKPLSGTAYKLKLLEQEIVDLVQSLTQTD